ncbi:Tellurite resistance protein TerB [Synechococcus sp. RSCCF101]|uniref:tellurite resistance TerB family protein n=1 Tax=Synechococcus sp. RSCCF101 TaxID=2511069 RepID=UPI0012475784|nr:tellurite resistance TerB family protein [Synechococcus sp. RSCCF101]QEY33197.1 Tellurite resistance protein TerB [Synechococcus sp. RSCCF101]
MTSTLPSPTMAEATPAAAGSSRLDPIKALAAVALSAVSWDGVLSKAGSRALRHSLDYREPYRSMSDKEMVAMIDELLQILRTRGAQHLMLDAAQTLSMAQRRTAYAMAAEIMRSDGPLEDDERNILASLADAFELPASLTEKVIEVMTMLHADVFYGLR